ncbi:MAG: hypothetical protein SVR94_02155 [Pseudomonadota bacterium]|nr:hypothetical protein [Pseudomonadota bacterium]
MDQNGLSASQSLQLALLDGSSSVKRSDNFQGDPNHYTHPVIESLKITKAQYIGRGSPFKSQFSPWLTTIIGGRGTGKSTLLEFLRITLRREKELPKNLKQDFAKYTKKCQGRQDDGLMTENTELKVIYCKDRERYQLMWRLDGQIEPISQAVGENGWRPSSGEITSRFPIRIYSQKQIFELAKQPQALLKIIDDAPEIEFRQWQADYEKLEHEFLRLRADIRAIEAELQEEERLKGELEDINNQLALFESKGYAEVLKTYQIRQQQLRAIEKWEANWTHVDEKVQHFLEEIMPIELDETPFKTENSTDKQCLDAMNQFLEGSIHNTQVRKEICQVMEGGKDALERRYRRMQTHV